MQEHIFYGFFRTCFEPAKPSKTVGLHRDDFNRSCILLLRLLPKSCGHTEWRYFKHTWMQGMAWRSVTLQGAKFGCKICILCADCKEPGAAWDSGFSANRVADAKHAEELEEADLLSGKGGERSYEGEGLATRAGRPPAARGGSISRSTTRR